MIDEEENNKEPEHKTVSVFKFFKYTKEVKISILAQFILEDLNYPIITETEVEECIKTYKLLEKTDEELNKRFIEIMKYKMFPMLRKKVNND